VSRCRRRDEALRRGTKAPSHVDSGIRAQRAGTRAGTVLVQLLDYSRRHSVVVISLDSYWAGWLLRLSQEPVTSGWNCEEITIQVIRLILGSSVSHNWNSLTNWWLMRTGSKHKAHVMEQDHKTSFSYTVCWTIKTLTSWQKVVALQ